MARMSLKKAFDAFMDARLTERINHVKSIYYDGDVLKAGATIEEVTDHINRVKSSHANIFKNTGDLSANQEEFLNKILNGPKGKKTFINGKSYAMYGSLKEGKSYPYIMPIGDNIREGVLSYDTASWFEGTRTGKPNNGKINTFDTNLNSFINNPNIEIGIDGDAIKDIKTTINRVKEAAKNGSPSTIIKDRYELENVLEKKSFSVPNLSRTNNRGPLRPDMVMNGNSLEIDSIYNYSIPNSVNKGWGHTPPPESSTYDDVMNVEKQREQARQQQRTIDMNDPSSWTDDDIREMAQGDPEYAQELINQRDAARGQNQSQQQANQNAPDTDQVINNVEQTQQTTNQRTQSDWRQKIKDEERSRRGVNRIDIDEATAQVKVDTSDPYNIYKTTTDAQGNTRTQHWNRKNANGGDATLVSDVTFNADATYNNITGEYSGPDRSHIDWINADEWDDDYILNRAGDNEELMNSMMNARERKIQANEKYRQEHPDMNNPDDINASNNVDSPSPDKPIPETTHNVNTRPQVDPNNPLTWTESYMDEISEGDPTYYENLKQQKLNAERIERFKNIDPNNPTTWTDEYIQHTASSQDEINNMTQQMRTAKNSDLVDELNQQRRVEAEMPGPNRKQRHQIHNDNKQKGNKQKPMTKAEKAKRKRQQQFETRHNAIGNNPDEVKKANRQYNKEQKQKKGEYQQNKNNPNKTMSKNFNENDPLTWTDQDIADMADGDMDLYEDLKARKANAKNGNPHGPNNRIPDEFEFSDAQDVDLNNIDAPDSEWVDDLVKNADDMAEEAIESGVKGLGKLGTMDMIMSGVNVLGAIGDYKTARRKGHGVVSSAVRAGAEFAVSEALGLWYLPVQLLKHTPGAVIKGADALYKENRRMNSAATNQVFGDAEFMDTQQLATMRQSGMEMAKMAQYNLQQTLMGNEATYLHR